MDDDKEAVVLEATLVISSIYDNLDTDEIITLLINRFKKNINSLSGCDINFEIKREGYLVNLKYDKDLPAIMDLDNVDSINPICNKDLFRMALDNYLPSDRYMYINLLVPIYGSER